MLFRPNALVFDIGAADGSTARGYLDHKAGHVVAVEADPFNYRALFDNVFDDDRIRPLLAAAWHELTLVDVYHAQGQAERTTTHLDRWKGIYTDTEFHPAVPVPSVTLDLLAKRFGVPQYIKVDVEGAELEVLKGMSFKPDVLSFEFHGVTMYETVGCLEICERLGFTHGNYECEHPSWDVPLTRTLADIRHSLETFLPGWGNITLR